MTSSLTWTATALHRLRVSSQLSTHLALLLAVLLTTSRPADAVDSSPTIVSNQVLARTRHLLAAPTKQLPDAVDRQRLNVNEAPKTNTSFSSKNVVALTNTTSCRLGNVDADYDGGTIKPRLDDNCRMSNRRGAKLSPHAADPVSVILKSFFKIQNTSASPALQQSKLHRKLSLRDQRCSRASCTESCHYVTNSGTQATLCRHHWPRRSSRRKMGTNFSGPSTHPATTRTFWTQTAGAVPEKSSTDLQRTTARGASFLMISRHMTVQWL